MTTAEPQPELHAISAEDLAWEEPRRERSSGSDALVLRAEDFEGPLDWLLEQARAGRLDLARLPVLALIEQCVTVLNGPGPATGYCWHG